MTKEGLKYPEMKDFPWVTEMEHLKKEGKSKLKSGAGLPLLTLAEKPKVPVNLLLSVMKDASLRPEVMAAYASAPIDGQIPPREGHLIMWFGEYVGHKYGNVPNVALEITIPMRKLANNFYEGLDDPNLLVDLLKSFRVCADDKVKYD